MFFIFINNYNLSINPFDPSIVRTFSSPLKLPHCTGLIAYQIVLIHTRHRLYCKNATITCFKNFFIN